MGSDVVLSSGDLVEYAAPDVGRTVRAVVDGFEVAVRGSGELEASVWLHEGAVQMADPVETEAAGVTVVETEVQADLERRFVCRPLADLLSFKGFRVVRRGNSPRELTNYEIG